MQNFPLYLKKAGLASRNIVHVLKKHSTLCRFLPLYSSAGLARGRSGRTFAVVMQNHWTLVISVITKAKCLVVQWPFHRYVFADL